MTNQSNFSMARWWSVTPICHSGSSSEYTSWAFHGWCKKTGLTSARGVTSSATDLTFYTQGQKTTDRLTVFNLYAQLLKHMKQKITARPLCTPWLILHRTACHTCMNDHIWIKTVDINWKRLIRNCLLLFCKSVHSFQAFQSIKECSRIYFIKSWRRSTMWWMQRLSERKEISSRLSGMQKQSFMM